MAAGDPDQRVAGPPPQVQPRADRSVAGRRCGVLVVPHLDRRGSVPLLGHAAPRLPWWLLRGRHTHRAATATSPLPGPAGAALRGGVPDQADRPDARAAARHGAVTAPPRPQAVRAGAMGLRGRIWRDDWTGGPTRGCSMDRLITCGAAVEQLWGFLDHEVAHNNHHA